MRDKIESRKCGGCGMIHPPPWDTQCPIANNVALEQDEKSKTIVDFCSKLAEFLHTRDDYEKIINGMNVFIHKVKTLNKTK